MRLSKILSIALVLGINFYCRAQDSILNLATLQGAWNCQLFVQLPYTQIAHDASHYTITYSWLAVVEGDKLYNFDYPCHYNGVNTIAINGDSLYMGEPLRAYEKIVQNNDSTLFSFHFYDAQYHLATTAWYRTKIDPARLEQLRRDSFNYECLKVDFSLKTVSDAYYGEGGDSLYFPLPLPRQIYIPDADSARRLDQSRQIQLSIMGRQCLFDVKHLDWHKNNGQHPYNYPKMRLSPAGWWRGIPFEADYESTSKDLASIGVSDLRPARKDKPILDSFVRSHHNILFWEVPICQQAKNPIINEIANKTKQLGYSDNPFWAQQLPEYAEIHRLQPLQSGEYYYYKLKPNKHRVFHCFANQSETEKINLAPLRKVSDILVYYCRSDAKLPSEDTRNDFCVEVWQFANDKEAANAKAFFDLHLHDNESLQNYPALYAYCYAPLASMSAQKGKYLYHFYARPYAWEIMETLEKLAKQL